MPNVMRWFWWRFSRVDSTGRLREYFRKRDFFAGGVLGGEVVQVGTNETTIESCCDIVWVTFYLFVS
jgi:hypothetical protein